MVVIPFPSRPPGPRRNSPPSPLSSVIAALHILGEPATAEEISDLIETSVLAFGQFDPAKVRAVIGLYEEDGRGGGLFRSVKFQGRQGWAFTPAFRIKMRAAGIQMTLRPLEVEAWARDEQADPADAGARVRVREDAKA